MKFRVAILLGFIPLVVMLLVATVAGVSYVLHRSARAQIAVDLQRSRVVFEVQQAHRRSLLLTQNRVVADEPRLKAVVATEQITHETVLGVAQELQKLVESDLFVITDGRGRLLCDVTSPQDSGFDLSHYPVVSTAIARGEATDLWIEGKRAFLVQATRLGFGSTVVGVVVIGYALGDETAAAVHRQTGTTVAVQLAGEVIAMAPGDGRGSLTSALAAKIPSGTTAPVEISLATGRHLALAGSFPGYAGGQPMRVLLLRSLDEALGPARTVIRYLFALLAAAVLASLLLSLALARRLALPIDRLVALTRQVGSGELSSRVRPEGPREIRTLGLAMNRMLDQVEEFRGKLAARERVEREMEIAVSIQTAILPREIVAPGFEIAAAMRPATEVGGDYYDVVPVEGGCWLGIGDVAGHGLQAGVVMMMAQSAVGALARCIPPPLPSEALRAANGLLVENVRRRSGRHEHVTLSLLRCYSDGRVVFAGAHEDIAIWRARSQRVEIIKTGGAWMGIRDQAQIVEDEFRLELGDLMLLHTDGATEAMNSRGDQFGLERLVEAFEVVRERPCKEIRDHLLEKIAGWTHEQHDDVTVLVLRCVSHQA